MIVKIFKTNQIIANIFIVVLAVLMLLPGYFSGLAPSVELNLANYSWFNFRIENRFIEVLLFSLLIGFQGVLLNYIINREKLIKGNTHLVGLFYVILNSGVSILFAVNPIIISNTLIITILWLFFKLYSLHNAKSLLFNIGFLLGISVLIYAPLFCLFPLIWIVLSYIRTPNFRDFFVSLLGFLLPFIYLFAYLYITNQLFNSNYIDWIYYPAIFSIHIINKPFLYFFVIVIGFVLLAFFSMFFQLERDVIKDRKLFIVFILLTLFFFVTLVFNSDGYNSLYILLTIPFSVFLANYFNKLKKEWLAEVFFTIILLGILGGYFL